MSDPAARAPATRLRVLLVEDNPGDARLIEKRLSFDDGARVTQVESLREALESLEREAPDVILLDLHLPDSQGPECIGELRALRPSVPIVVLTNDASEDRGFEALQAGADEFLSKDDFAQISLDRTIRFAIERHRLQEEMQALLLDNAEPMLVLSRGGGILFANAAAKGLLGNSLDQLPHRTVEVPEVSAWLPRTFTRADGSSVDTEVRTSPVSWHGQVAILAVLRDVGEVRALERSRRAAEQARMESDSRLGLVLGELPLALWTTDADLNLLSHHGDAALGPRPPEDDSLTRLTCPHPSVLEAHREALARGSARFEYVLGDRAVEGFVRSARGGPGQVPGSLVGLAMEVTERRRLEQQLNQSQRMEAVGRLAGGIAHDFNNLLTAILSFGYFAMQRIGSSHPAHDDVQEIMRTADRASDLTRRLLTFSRRQSLEPRVVDLRESIRESEKLLSRLLSAEIRLDVDLPRELWPVHIDPAAFEQILLNLSVNARDAMPEGGLLRIEAENVSVRAAGDGPAGLRVEPGEYVGVRVRDTGCGMPADVLARAFEPFFTTKGEGSGTGLGLSIVYGIVEQSGGRIAIESSPGRGTTMHMLWPRSTAVRRVSTVPATEVAEAAPATVLLAEDDDAVRSLVKRALEKGGFRVLVAADGVEALELAQRHGSGIDLVLSDVIMPRLNGRKLALRLRRVLPGARMLFMSGYPGASADEVLADAAGEEFFPVVGKPLTPAKLVGAVQAALEGGPRLGDLRPRSRVLVVDDDAGILRAVTRILRDRWDVVVSDRAADAATLIGEQSFDAILCDIVMPDMSGAELHAWTRREHPREASKFVFLTGAVGDDSVDSFLAEADRPVLLKPLDAESMQRAVRETVEAQPQDC